MIGREEREQWRALVEADTLHLLPIEAHIASVKHLAERLLALTDGRARLWADGFGIERLPVEVTVGDEAIAAVVVRIDELLALEDLLADASNILALCDSSGIRWDDAGERDAFFAMAEQVWQGVTSRWRGAEGQYEADAEQRPQ